jgi:ATP phosphoribosyltransferase
MMNVRHKADLPAVLKVLPSQNPTVSPLADGEGVDVVVILDEYVVRRIVPQLKQAGASMIVEYALNKIID